MKKIYLLFVVSFLSVLAKGQVTLFTDSFNTGSSAGWQLDEDAVFDLWTVNNSYNCGDVTPDQGGGYYLHISDDLGGNDCAYANFLESSGGGAVYATMTSGLSTVGQTSVSIKFDWLCYGQTGNILPSFGTIDYSIDGGSNWTNITQPRAVYSGQPTWTTTAINSTQVPAILNHADLRIRFGFTNSGVGNNPAFAVDNIVISGNVTTSVSPSLQANPLSLGIFPNPAKDNIYIMTNSLTGNGVVTIYNMAGEKMISVLKEYNEIKMISIKNLAAGIYILQMQSDTGTSYAKLAKE